MAYSDWLERVPRQAKIGSSKICSPDDLKDAIEDAVETYSAVKPRQKVAKWDAGALEVCLSQKVTGWLQDSHQVTKLYTPTRHPEHAVDSNGWWTYQNPDGSVVLVLECVASGQVWMEYACPHVIDDQVDTVTTECPGDRRALVHLMASYLLTRAANHYSEKLKAVELGGGDAIDYAALQRDSESRAESERKEFERRMLGWLGRAATDSKGGSAEGQPRPAWGRVDWDSRTTGGTDRFAHRARWT